FAVLGTYKNQRPDLGCHFSFYSRQHSSGSFSSPNFPFEYPEKLHCQYVFYARPRERVRIEFSDFSTETLSESCPDGESDFVHAEECDRPGLPALARLCGDPSIRGRRFRLERQTTCLRLVFVSNSRYSAMGFFANYFFEKYSSDLNVYNHFLMNVESTDHVAEFFKGNSAVSILVGKDNCLVHYLLQLAVFQVVADHHLQHLRTESAIDKLFEIDFTVLICIEDVNDSLHQRVLLKFRHLETVYANWPSGGRKRELQVTLEQASFSNQANQRRRPTATHSSEIDRVSTSSSDDDEEATLDEAGAPQGTEDLDQRIARQEKLLRLRTLQRQTAEIEAELENKPGQQSRKLQSPLPIDRPLLPMSRSWDFQTWAFKASTALLPGRRERESLQLLSNHILAPNKPKQQPSGFGGPIDPEGRELCARLLRLLRGAPAPVLHFKKLDRGRRGAQLAAQLPRRKPKSNPRCPPAGPVPSPSSPSLSHPTSPQPPGKAELTDDPDREFLLNGIRNGFQLTCPDPSERASTMSEIQNYLSVNSYRQLVEQQVREEILNGRYVQVSDKPEVISALGAIPKGNNKIRLIHDCSNPPGLSLNSRFSSDYRIKFETVSHFTAKLQPGWFMAKVDLANAYRSVGISPHDFRLTGLKWKFSDQRSDSYICDTRLPFGAAASVEVFHRLSQAVKRMMQRRGFNDIGSYLDDFAIAASSKDDCQLALDTLLNLLRKLGFSINWSKVVAPCTRLVYLGVLIDTVSGLLELPKDKLDATKSQLQSALSRKRITKRQLQSLCGRINWVCQVVRIGRCFLRPLLLELSDLKQQRHKLRVHNDLREILSCWAIESDASNWGGCGIIRGPDITSWLIMDWHRDSTEIEPLHINFKESLAPVLTALHFQQQLQPGSQLVIYSDSTAAVGAINKGSSPNRVVNSALQQLMLLAAHRDLSVQAFHVPGTFQIFADSGSRADDISELTNFLLRLFGSVHVDLSNLREHTLSPATCEFLALQIARLNANFSKRYRELCHLAFAETTARSYRCQIDSWKRFCKQMRIDSTRPSLQQVAHYIIALSDRLSSHASVGAYINAADLHCKLKTGRGLPRDPRIDLLLRGVQRKLAKPPARKAPITPGDLLKLRGTLRLQQPQDAAFWAAVLVGFWGLLRRANLCCSKPFPPAGEAVTCGDLQVSPDLAILHIRRSKTNQFRQRVHRVVLPRLRHAAQHPLCPVAALLHHLRINQPDRAAAAHLFAYRSSGGLTPLTGTRFCRLFQHVVHRAGLADRSLSPHSLRRGGASLAFRAGVPLPVVKALGDWRSSAVEVYLGLEKGFDLQLAAVRKLLLSSACTASEIGKPQARKNGVKLSDTWTDSSFKYASILDWSLPSAKCVSASSVRYVRFNALNGSQPKPGPEASTYADQFRLAPRSLTGLERAVRTSEPGLSAARLARETQETTRHRQRQLPACHFLPGQHGNESTSVVLSGPQGVAVVGGHGGDGQTQRAQPAVSWKVAQSRLSRIRVAPVPGVTAAQQAASAGNEAQNLAPVQAGHQCGLPAGLLSQELFMSEVNRPTFAVLAGGNDNGGIGVRPVTRRAIAKSDCGQQQQLLRVRQFVPRMCAVAERATPRLSYKTTNPGWQAIKLLLIRYKSVERSFRQQAGSSAHSLQEAEQPISDCFISMALVEMTPSTMSWSNATTTETRYWAWDPEFEALIHPFWRQFPPVPELHHYLVGFYISVVGIIGDVGNMLVLFIFVTTKALRTPPNIFLVNLAISDLSFSVIMGFPLLTISSFNGRWAWGRLACELYGFFGGVLGFVSIHTLALISMDRYFVIAQPFEALKRLTYTRAIVMVFFAWLLALLWAIPPFFGYGYFVPEGFQTSCTFDYLSQDKGNLIFNGLMYSCGFVLPLSIIFFCYYKIVRAVRSHELELIKMATKMGGHSMKSADQKSDLKTAKIALITISLYLLSWTPYATVAFLSLIGKRDHLNQYTSELPVLAAKTSAIYNPIIYSLSHPKFRAVLEKKFPWLLCCCPPKAKEREATSSAGSKFSRRDTEKDSGFPSQRAPEDGAAAPPAITEGNENKGYETDRV
uniref:CUB domain-containing protein n=2 Tax=Macrostomum lignano TaxID=282301 RepID=A0A1I8I7K6_9PLAT